MKKNWVNDVYKAAFAVGCGFTVGKFVGKLYNSVIGGVISGFVDELKDRRNQKFAESSTSTKTQD